jgi:hypothetical protein
MTDGGIAACVGVCDAPETEIERISRKTILRLKAIPWRRVIVDTLLLAGIVLASSSFLAVK